MIKVNKKIEQTCILIINMQYSIDFLYQKQLNGAVLLMTNGWITLKQGTKE